MSEQKKLTGYPSIDKPWLKFYRNNRKEFSRMGLYDYLKECNKDNLKSNALMYFGKTYSFQQLINDIDNLSKVFVNEGIKPKDKVIVLALNTPDTICAIYALNKIGAISCIEYITQTDANLGNITKLYGSKYAVVIDAVYEKYSGILLANGIEKIFLTKLTDSMPSILKTASLFKKPVQINNKECTILLKQKSREIFDKIEAYDWSSNETAIILSTSGTTGVPKRAELSCDAINSLAYQGQYVDLDLKPGKTILTPAPPFLAFGISLTIHMPLCNGVCLILSPSPDPDFVVKQFIKYKPNLFIGGHIFLDKLMNNTKAKKMDFSFVSAIEIGGESVTPEYIKELTLFLKERNCSGGVYTGYGMTELAGCSTTESHSAIKSGSVGIPLCNVNMKVIDIISNEELPYGTEGEVCISSPCMMNGYFENEEATNEMIELDNDGVRWIHTGDMAKIDNEGFVYIVGRIKRIEITIDPATNAQVKLYPDYIEHLLNAMDDVERSAVVTIDNPNRRSVPIAFVKLHDNNKADKSKIDKYFEENTEPYNKPIEYYFVNEIPVLPNGKIDYQTLTKSYL